MVELVRIVQEGTGAVAQVAAGTPVPVGWRAAPVKPARGTKK